MRVICVAGARPNFMKVKPVIDALEEMGAETFFVHTGQHYDAEMSDVFLADLGLRKPDRYLGVGSGTQADQVARTMMSFEKVVDELAPDVVVVVGDVNSTMACALVGAKSPAEVAHVEAGLRSGDWKMPEEVNRVVTDRVSDHLFASTPESVDALLAEGSPRERIHLVGNTMIDTLIANLDRAREMDTAGDLGVETGEYGVVTLHRPSNVDHDATLGEIVDALVEISSRVSLVWPMHPRTRKKLSALSLPARLAVVEPLGYLDFISLQAGAKLVLTDSGGIQEETTVLGIPCLTLRDTTERPITITNGTNRLVGTRSSEVVAAAFDVLDHGIEIKRPELWDGRASERIARILMETHRRSR